MISPSEKKYNIGLVLSGGGMRGFVHLGVIKALNANGIFPEVISGTSAGSLVGALYADGHTPDEIFKVFANKKLFTFLEFIVPNRGFVRMTGLQKVLLGMMRSKTFEQLRIPLYVAITDLNRGVCEYINTGELTPYILASCSVPIVFQPMVINGVTYVDGGVLDNLPVKPIRHLCNKIIGVNSNIILPKKNLNRVSTIADRCTHLLIQKTIDTQRDQFDLLIEPTGMHRFHLFDISKAKDMMDIGYDTSMPILEEALKQGSL